MAEMISGATGALQGTVGGMLNQGSAWLDSIFPPEKRNELMAKISKFASEKPMLASFIASQVALTGFPLGLFIVMTITVVIFALLAGLIIGLVGAVLFIVVCVGFALIILLPTLFITTAAATFIWLWGVGGYYILKWFNKKEIPGIHTDMNQGTYDAIMGKGETEGESKDEAENKEANGKPKPPKLANGSAKDGKGGAAAGKGMNGVADKLGNPKEAADVGKHAGTAANKAQNTVGGVKGGVGGAFGV